MEVCPSGLRSTLGKRVSGQPFRRFESSRFRHTKRNPFRDLFLYAWWDTIDVRRYENRRNRIKSRACSNFFEVTPDFIDLLRKSIILSLPPYKVSKLMFFNMLRHGYIKDANTFIAGILALFQLGILSE